MAQEAWGQWRRSSNCPPVTLRRPSLASTPGTGLPAPWGAVAKPSTLCPGWHCQQQRCPCAHRTVPQAPLSSCLPRLGACSTSEDTEGGRGRDPGTGTEEGFSPCWCWEARWPASGGEGIDIFLSERGVGGEGTEKVLELEGAGSGAQMLQRHWEDVTVSATSQLADIEHRGLSLETGLDEGSVSVGTRHKGSGGGDGGRRGGAGGEV